jgi:type I restriction enzyme M protein
MPKISKRDAGKAQTKKQSMKKVKVEEDKPRNGIVELTKELWQAAVTLRGSIEPADYKRYVLPIIFLRFLSLRYEKRRAQLEKLIADPKSDYFGDKKALDDPDEYRSANTFIVPKEARWERIVNDVARRDDVKVQMDKVLKVLEDTYPEKLRGLLPPIYAGSNLDPENLRSLINLFSKEIFEADQDGEDVIGRVYEYFIGEFASSEGKRGGEYFTPLSIVKTLVAMLEPERGKVFDPCCGSGGMFVQSDVFTKHSGRLSFYGQESKDFTYRLCRMNLFIHGLDGDIKLGNSYFNDQFDKLKADYLLANPPFNDGSKGENGWGADKVSNKDPRLDLGMLDDEGRKRPMPLSPKNGNTMWILHFLNHLAPGGTAGFVMATGELSNSETARLEVRKTLVDLDFVDCVVQLTGQLFAQTGIPCALWFLSRSRDGSKGCRKRKGEILFIDARNLGVLMPGSRKQKFLSDDEINRIAAVYREFKRTGRPKDIPGFCGVAAKEVVEQNNYALTPGRYVGSGDIDDESEPFEEKMQRLAKTLEEQFEESSKLEKAIRKNLAGLGIS